MTLALPKPSFACLNAAMLAAMLPAKPGAPDEQASIAPGKPLSFHVKEGTRLRKVFERDLALVTLSGSSRIESLFGSYELELGRWHDAQRVVLVDTYGAPTDGVPASISRAFEAIEMDHRHTWKVKSWGEFEGEVDRSGRGVLEERQVLFEKVVESIAPDIAPEALHEAAYAATWIGGSESAPSEGPRTDDEQLAELVAATDLTGLLPWRPVQVGDAWFTEVDFFEELCWPSGRLDFVNPAVEPLVVPVDQRLDENLDGTVRVELEAIETLEGVPFARLGLRGRMESQATFDYTWTWSATGGETTTGPVTVELEATFAGTAWWNLAAGHLNSIDLRADLEVEQDMSGLSGGLSNSLVEVFGKDRVWAGELTARARFE